MLPLRHFTSKALLDYRNSVTPRIKDKWLEYVPKVVRLPAKEAVLKPTPAEHSLLPQLDPSAHAKQPPPYRISLKTGHGVGPPKKMCYVTRQINNLSLDEAIVQMQFSEKKPAIRVHELLLKAREQVAKDGKDPSLLRINGVIVGRGSITKSLDFKGRGRHGIYRKRESMVTVSVAEPNYEKLYKKKYWLPRITNENKRVVFPLSY